MIWRAIDMPAGGESERLPSRRCPLYGEPAAPAASWANVSDMILCV